MKVNKVLLSPSSFGQCGNESIKLLENKNYQIVLNPYGRKLTESEVIELAYDCVAIVAGLEPLNSQVMGSLKNLKCISRVGVGLDNIDLEYTSKNGIKVINTPDGPTRSVAEMTIAMTFALLRKIPQADSNIKRGIWKKEIGNLLYGKKIGIIGLGRIGKMVTEMFTKFGNEVIGYDLFPDRDWAYNQSIELTSLEKLLKESNIVSLHIPAQKDKIPILGESQFLLMKKGSFLINIARGGVVDEESLYNVLKNNHLAGAAIDVFAYEPYTGPLTKLKNVVLTPHLGSYAAEGKLQMEIDAVNNLIKILGGKE